MAIPQLTAQEIRRFWNKVDQPSTNSCWEWNACRNWFGYGQVGFRYKLYSAHRIAWYLEHGTDPLDAQVLHRCDNPPCCNPKHLFVGTQLDNVTDMIQKGRADHTHNLKGESVGTAKLSEQDVKEIWRLHLTEGLGERKLARQFNVTPPNIHHILSGKGWKHLTPADRTQLIRPVNGRPRRLP